MSFMPTKWIKRDFLLVIMFLQLMVYVTVFFDIPIARQVLGFFYFTFLPGFIILKLLKLDRFDWVETVLFSVGLSIAFLMLGGLLVNEFGLLFGVSQPLSVVPLMTVLNSLILIGVVLVYLKSEDVEIWKSEPVEKSPFVLLFLCLPILSIVGAMYVNAYGNNFLLLFLLIAISLLLVMSVISKKFLSSKLYPLAVLMIAISLLYHFSLVSNYLVGSDIHVEHYIFQTIEISKYWSPTNPYSGDTGLGRLHSMLSITILSTVYSTMLSMDSTWVFKLLYPLIFSFVPLGLYQVWQTYVSKKYAFISAFLFMAQATFYTEMLGLNRQMIAELFFVLLLLVILNKKMKSVNKTVCFMIFSFALVTSHYALPEIFLFSISLVLISLLVLKRPSRNISVGMVVFFFALMFTWYIYTSGSAAFDSILGFGDYVYRQLGDFFNPASRGQTVLRGLGLESPPTIWNAISRTFAYLVQALFVFGFVGLITRRVKPNFDREYYVLTSVAMVILAALILVPGLANTLNMTRFYHILLFFLAPFCVLGAEVIASFLYKRKTEIVTLILMLGILTPYFLFQTNFVYEVTGSQSWSLPLSGHRLGIRLHTNFALVTEQEVYGARWLSRHSGAEDPIVFADSYIFSVLVGYGMLTKISTLTNVTEPKEGSFVYLGTLNTVYGVIIGQDTWNTTDILESNFGFSSKLYSSHACEIYKITNP